MYGLQGELVTDCRYLTVAGARAAVDSEANVALHKADRNRQRRNFYEYVEREGRGRAFECDCGWRGSYEQLKKAPLRYALRCPSCGGDTVYMSIGTDG